MKAQYPSGAPLSVVPPPGAILILACGNDLRGDDALGARFIAEIEKLKPNLPPAWQRAIVTHWQLQWGPETALLLANRQTICFVDAYIATDKTTEVGDATANPPPFVATPLSPASGDLTPLLTSVGSHRVTPPMLLAAAQLLEITLPPSLWQIAIGGQSFKLGAPLSPFATRALAATLDWFWSWLVGETPICINSTIPLN